MLKKSLVRVFSLTLSLLVIISVMTMGFASAESYDGFTYSVKTAYDENYNESKYIIITGYTGSSKNVEIPSVIEGKDVKVIDAYAFKGNTDITSVKVPASVTKIDINAFKGCTNLDSVELPSTLTEIGANILSDTAYEYNNKTYGLLYCGNYLLDADKYEIGSSIKVKEGTTLIADSAFFNAEISSVKFPSSLKHIGLDAFGFCKNLTSVTIPESIETIGGYAFEFCENLKSINIPAGIKSLGHYCFSNCTSLTGVDLPASITVYPNGLFSHCTSITSFTVNSSVTDIGYNTFTETGIKTMHIPANVKYIDASAFDWCRNLSSFTVDPANQYFYVTADGLYKRATYTGGDDRVVRYFCSPAITSVTAPENVYYIDMYALSGNEYIKTLTLSSKFSDLSLIDAVGLENVYVNSANTDLSSENGILYSDHGMVLEYYPPAKTASTFVIPARVTTIDDYAFDENPFITEITIPATVTKVSYAAIVRCENLKTLNLEATTGLDSACIENCYALEAINFKGTKAEWENLGLRFSQYECDGLYAYCTDGTVEIIPPAVRFEVGDVNCDGKINIKDATAIQKYVAKMIEFTEEQETLADYNGDTKINVKDATAIQKKLAGII